MAASGTGLPLAGTGGGLTPSVDLSSYGAADGAAAEGFARLGGGLAKVNREVLEPLAVDQARKDAAEAVLRGDFVERETLTPYGREYMAAQEAGSVASFNSDDDTFLGGLMAENPYDPDAFLARANARKTEMLEARPGSLALAWASRFDARRDDIVNNMRLARVREQTAEAGAALVGRREEIVARIGSKAETLAALDHAAPEFAEELAELDEIDAQIASNPVLGVNEEESARRRVLTEDFIRARGFAGLVRRAYREQGPDAALAMIQTSLPAVGDDGAPLPSVVTPSAGERPAGMVGRGNIDLSTRPTVDNGDGTISTVRSITIESDGRYILIPTVTDEGQVVDDAAAVALFGETGRNLGAFDSEASASAYAATLHNDQAAGRTGAPLLSGRARDAAYDMAVAAFNQERSLNEQRLNIANARQTQAKGHAENLLESMRYGADVDHEQLRALAEASGDPSLVARVRWAIEVGVTPPEGFGTGGSGAAGSFDGDASTVGGFNAWSEFFFEAEGGDVLIPNDNGRGPSRWGINATANPDLDVPNLIGAAGKAIATRRLRERYWNAIGGDELPPALAFVAADAAAVAGPGAAREWIQRANGDVGVFLQQQEAHYRSLARSNPTRYGDDLRGWLNRMERARGYAARIQSFTNATDGFAPDPISFATGGANRPALARVPALSIDGFMSPNPGERGGWFNAVRARYAVGETLADQYQVPRRVFTNAEVTSYAARFRDDPTAIIPFATSLTEALGGRKAREALVELGQGGSASTVIHIADLASTGGDRRFAEQAALGLVRRGAGETLAKETSDEIAEELREFRSSFRESPQFMQAVSNAALAAALADDAAGDRRAPSYYVQAALGRTTWQGRTYGGGGEVNGARVLLPRWLNPDSADDALEALAENWERHGVGPRYSNDQPMRARDVARLRPRIMPNGRYQLVDRDGRAAYAASGTAFEINMEAGRAFLRSRLGAEAVRPD
jgi:hypothetical protein